MQTPDVQFDDGAWSYLFSVCVAEAKRIESLRQFAEEHEHITGRFLGGVLPDERRSRLKVARRRKESRIVPFDQSFGRGR